MEEVEAVDDEEFFRTFLMSVTIFGLLELMRGRSRFKKSSDRNVQLERKVERGEGNRRR